jgi:hypothetical protein
MVGSLGACHTQVVDLGGKTDASADGPGSAGSGTILIVTCNGGSTDATLGAGYNSMRPAACIAPRGPTASVSSPADVVALLVGTWNECGHSAFGIDQGAPWNGVELTSDGHYYALGQAEDGSLVRFDSMRVFSGSSSGGSSGSSGGDDSGIPANADGTFTVVDGTATYGPGTYQLRLQPADGGLFVGQVVVTDGPRQIHYFPTNASEQVFAGALPWSPRKGVCSCVDTSGTVVDRNDPAGLTSALTGRWLWCGAQLNGPPGEAVASGPPVGTAAMGIEFPGDGAWYALEEDASGTLVRGSGAFDHGTFQFVTTSSLGLSGSGAPGPEPLVLELQMQSQFELDQVVVTSDPRSLFFSTGTTSSGGPGGTVNNYAILFPMK